MCKHYTGRTSLDFAGSIDAQALESSGARLGRALDKVGSETFPGYRDFRIDDVMGETRERAALITPGMQPGNVALDNGPTFTIYIDGTAKYRVPFGAVADAEARREMGPQLAEAVINGERERVQESLRAHFSTRHGVGPHRVSVAFSPAMAAAA